MNKKDLLYSTGDYIQYPMKNHKEKEHEKNVYICITGSLCCKTLQISYTSIKYNKKIHNHMSLTFKIKLT